MLSVGGAGEMSRRAFCLKIKKKKGYISVCLGLFDEEIV
jgi:hypothetical protein